MRTVAIVQARMESTRLPRKVLADVAGTPLLRLVLDRTSAATRVDAVVAAIPDTASNDALGAAIESWGYQVVRGSADDVLSRYLAAARATAADIIVRITGDCPLIDPALVDRVVGTLTENDALDYVALGESFPDGENAEAVRRGVLERADRQASLKSHREHVTLFIRDQPNQFALHYVEHVEDAQDVRLSVDEQADLDVIRQLVDRLGAEPSVSFVEYEKEYRDGVGKQNSHIVRDEGLWRSRNDDEVANVGMRHGRANSDAWLERSRKVIPCATQTLSKAVDQFVAGVTPTFLESGSGCKVTDVDGNTYIDYPMALGPILLGYSYPRTVQAVIEQMRLGTIFSLPHPLEVEVAERIVDMVPSAEMVRFGKNGSDATSAAVRLARAATGRDVVITCGYHGWHDWYVIQTARNAGVPSSMADLVDTFAFNDLPALDAALARHEGRVAGVILEVSVDEPAPGFLEGVRDRVHRAGGLLVFDEIITGFRYAPGGAQERYGVVPDITCLGKAIANGLPLSAVAGRADVMREFERVFFSGTFGGETLSLAAAKATLDEIAEGQVIPHLWSQGKRLRAGLQAIITDSGLDVELVGVPPRSGFVFRVDGEESAALKGLFFQETIRRGILYGGPVFITYSHRDADIDATLDATAAAFQVMAEAVTTDSVEERLEGPAPATIFRPVRT